jgi:polyferredoxin
MTLANYLGTLHVADWRRWQRVKIAVGSLIWIAGLASAGGSEWEPGTSDTSNMPLAFVLIVLSAAIFVNVEMRNRRLEGSYRS